MDRRSFLQLLAAGAIGAGLAGCAKVRPEPTDSAPTPTGLRVATDSSGAGDALASLLVTALVRAGSPAETTPADPATTVLDLKDRNLDIGPAPAASLLASLAEGTEPPADDEVLSELAGQVGPELSLLGTSHLNAGLVVAVSTGIAATGVSGIDQLLTRDDVRIATPSYGLDSPWGVPALQGGYQAPELATTTIDSVLERREAVMTQQATAGFFRAIDSVELDGLVVLDDPVGVLGTDPVALLFSSDLADSDPAAILTVNKVFDQLTDAEFKKLRIAARGRTAPWEAWLAEHDL